MSDHPGKRNGEILYGNVGSEISVENEKSAARETAIELLAVLQSTLGDLNCVVRTVRLSVMVNSAPDPQLRAPPF
jgi:hypothetical protein